MDSILMSVDRGVARPIGKRDGDPVSSANSKSGIAERISDVAHVTNLPPANK
ncbi:MAG TPA: hypothetical protein VG274_07295 [Rhizomicrobium sp.]|jgi:hypothetical protein|nr:hypothetical protein [Rhizomicrobium sp.]